MPWSYFIRDKKGPRRHALTSVYKYTRELERLPDVTVMLTGVLAVQGNHA